jgi:hypothetical protein
MSRTSKRPDASAIYSVFVRNHVEEEDVILPSGDFREIQRGCALFHQMTRSVSRLSPAGLAELIDLVVLSSPDERNRRRPHAYRDQHIKTLLGILRLPSPADLEHLHCVMDLFAGEVGRAIALERKAAISERADEVRRRFAQPATDLLKALEDNELQKEFAFEDSPFSLIFVDKFRLEIKKFISQADGHAVLLDSWKRRASGSLTKSHHVSMTAYLCEYMYLCESTDQEFKPKRSVQDGVEGGALLSAAELLADPLFPPNTSFVRQVRDFVHDWNLAMRAASEAVPLASERTNS